jgi:16S rRNA (uracil1498-N3)-methyltransferase
VSLSFISSGIIREIPVEVKSEILTLVIGNLGAGWVAGGLWLDGGRSQVYDWRAEDAVGICRKEVSAQMKKKRTRSRYGSAGRAGALHRFFVRPERIQDKEVVLGEQAHQIRDVLRLEVGERINVLDNEGAEYEVELTEVRKDEARGQVVEKREATGEPGVRITLYQSILLREKFEWVLQKCTEVGVARFVPVFTGRSVVRDSSIKASRFERWRRIIQEAAEQSRRGRLPELAAPVRFEDALEGLDGFDISLIASPEAKGKSLRDCLKGPGTAGTVAVFVGPEGGFTNDEANKACGNGAIAFSLGKRILRTETAAVVASSVILYEMGELEG